MRGNPVCAESPCIRVEAAAEAVDGCWAEKNGVKKVAVVKDFWGVVLVYEDTRVERHIDIFD